MRTAALVVGLLAAAFQACAADGLTVISFGRADQDALNYAFYSGFGRATGIPIKSLSYDGDTSDLAQMVRGGNPPWDLMQVESRALRQGCEQGLFEKLDLSRVGNTGDFISGAVSECGVGIFAWSVALAYSDRLAGTPASWADFWDLKRFPGKRGLRRSAKYTLEIALLADGVAPADVYTVLATDAGVDRAFRKLEQIKADTVWWEAAAQSGLLLAAGDIVMSPGYALWLDPERPGNENLRIAWNQSLYDVDSWAIVRGSANVADAYRFIAFASAPERQKLLSERVSYGPANRKALALLGADRARSLPSFDATLARALRVDAAFWIAHGEALERRFDAWAPAICRDQADDDDDAPTEQAVCQDVRGRMRVHRPGSGASDRVPGSGAPMNR